MTLSFRNKSINENGLEGRVHSADIHVWKITLIHNYSFYLFKIHFLMCRSWENLTEPFGLYIICNWSLLLMCCCPEAVCWTPLYICRLINTWGCSDECWTREERDRRLALEGVNSRTESGLKTSRRGLEELVLFVSGVQSLILSADTCYNH